jgi:hypothetical protein
MIESIVVFIIVAAALVVVSRSAWRSVSGKGKGCGCSSGGCPLTGICKSESKSHRHGEAK